MMTKNTSSTNGIVTKGRSNALKNNPEKERICAEIKKRYADHLARAGFFRKIILRYRMSREIKKEIEKLAPPDALYFR